MKIKRKNVKKIILISIMILLSLIPNFSRAFSAGDIFSKGDAFISKGSEEGSTISETSISDTVIPIAQMLVVIGSIVVSAATVVIGIKYLMASPEKKAELKSQLVGLVVATAVIYGAQFIWSLMYQIFA